MSSVETLLLLFDYVDDAGQLEVLIEAKNLQRIMHAAGHDDAAMRRMITAGETPGTMLLSVFKSGRSADEMMALIPPEDRKVEPAPVTSRPKPVSSGLTTSVRSPTSGAPGSTMSLGGFGLVISGAAICALAVKMPMLGLTFLVYWQVVLGVTAALGAVGGAILLEKARAVGAVVGGITSPLATYISYRYIMWMASDEMGRESLLIIEPILVNMVVVLLIFGLPMRLWSKRA